MVRPRAVGPRLSRRRPERWVRGGAAALLLVLAGSGGRADLAPWIGPEWTVRRAVDAEAATTGESGDEVAVCDFYSGGKVRPDGRDVRVATAARTLVPHKVLQVGPGDRVRVAFAVRPEVQRYYIYYGNPEAEAPEPWTPERGVLCEARWWRGGGLNNLAQVRQGWLRAEAAGTDFVTHVSFGFNPFGPSGRPCAFRFTGYFRVPAEGPYFFATTSDDGSWLRVDGRDVVSWPGEHGAARDARHARSILLEKGVHRLEYWYVNSGGAMIAVAAWRAPKQRHFQAIPPSAFLPVAQARLVEKDVRNQRITADFFPRHAGETWWPDHYGVRVKFENLSTGISIQRGGRFEWDFGDGQSSAEPTPRHVYLAHGDYAVTLKASRGPESHTFRSTVRIERDWWKQTEPHMEPRRRYAQEVAGYDFQRLDLRSLVLAVDLFEHLGMTEALVRAAGTLVLKRSGADEGDLERCGLLLAERLREADRPREALQTLRALEKRLESSGRRAAAAVEAADTLLEDLGRWEQAEAEYRRVLESYATAPRDLLRRARIGIGDVRRHEGKTDEARRAYREAARIRVGPRDPKRVAVRVGTLARYVEEYTRERQWEWAFKFLHDWAWEFPEEKLQGHWSYLRVKALLARGDGDAALAEAEDLLAVNPDSAYAVRLLMLAAECHLEAGRRDRARLLLQTAVEDYPEDAHREEARDRLEALGGAASEGPGGG